MPIYEFRCQKCNQVFELFAIRQDEKLEMRCPACHGTELERVLSGFSHVTGAPGAGRGGKTRVSAKSCSTGTCGTIEIPGPSR